MTTGTTVGNNSRVFVDVDAGTERIVGLRQRWSKYLSLYPQAIVAKLKDVRAAPCAVAKDNNSVTIAMLAGVWPKPPSSGDGLAVWTSCHDLFASRR